MIPSVVPQEDWPLYFEGAWMLHPHYGAGQIACRHTENGTLMLCLVTDRDSYEVQPDEVSLWWPSPGAYNYNGASYYFGKRARRSMRKSATDTDHYYTVYASPGGRPVLPLRIMAKGTSLIEWSVASDLFKKQAIKAVAITRDIILENLPDSIGVVFRGEKYGAVVDNKYVPFNEKARINVRIEDKLRREGVCQS